MSSPFHRRHLAAFAAAALALVPAQAGAFGTIYGLGQNGEHEKITRAALACPAGTPSDGNCFEPVSVTQIAGKEGVLGGYGGVGAPDIVPPAPAPAHCDDGDFLDRGDSPRGYGQTRGQADEALVSCRNELLRRFREGRDAASQLLGADGQIIGSEVDSTRCTFVGNLSGDAKCDVFDGFGRALHGVQDFYSHSNWSDGPVSKVSARNPPGMGQTTVVPLLNFRLIGPPPIPDALITGCFSVFEKGLSPTDGCLSNNIPPIPRVRHKELNKDEGDIDPVTGEATDPTTIRGKQGTNFARAVGLAIADTRRQWSDLRAEIIVKEGPKRGNLMICALTRDDPLKDCQGRKLGIVIDSSGSNTTTDPSNLRVTAAAAFNAGLVSAAEAGPGGRPDRSAVIDFDDGARIVSSLGDPDVASFAGIDSSGGTNIGAGVALAIEELTRDPADPTANRAGIVVLTDGESDRAALIAEINRASSLGIRISFGFLAPPATPVSSERSSAHQSRPAPPADLVGAVIASGGVFSTIDSAAAQEAFVTLVGSRGATNLDDPNGADDGGPLAQGVSATGLASPPADTDTFSFQATRGRLLNLEVRTLAGQALAVSQRDVGGGTVLARTRTKADGTAGVRTRLRRSRLVEIDVSARGAGGPYSVQLTESGVDRLGTRRADRLSCPALPTYVEGRAGADNIVCGTGDDMIWGGPGADFIAASAGDDIVLVGSRDGHAGTEVIVGGPGTDIVEFETGRKRAVRIPPGRPVVVSVGRARFKLRGVETVLFGYRR
ncbi:MAG: VWA domain-containing protein [Thermoleophilia bacterium]|nr:VWA domain-containing protein [Thermoleophilia bacterium]